MTANHRRLLALLPFLASSPLVAQSAWTRAPALPTACYGEQDSHGAALENAMKEMDAATAKLSAANRALVKQTFANPATLQQGLMSAQKDPAKAAEIMKSIQDLGGGVSQAASADAAQLAFDEKATKLKADYKADRDAMLVPIHVRIGQNLNEAGTGPKGIVEALWIEYNKKYETVLCPRWFAKEIPALLAQYRQYQVTDRIPKELEREATNGRLLELFGVPSSGYRPVAEMNGVLAYLRFVADLFTLRQIMPSRGPI